MKIVPLFEASDLSFEREHVWMPLIYGASEVLPERLGEPEVGDFLPGLGELCVWGIRSERAISGAIYTGFISEEAAVSVDISARVRDHKLMLDSLASFATLFREPSFSRLHILSMLQAERALEVRDRGELVLRTSSRAAAVLAVELVSRLVIDASAELVEVSTPPEEEVLSLRVLVNPNGDVRRFARPVEQRDGDWQTVVDWDDAP